MALTQTQVSQLYVSIFGRASEGEGNKYWMANGKDMASTANTMLATDAAKAYFGDSLKSDDAFIKHIYKNTLGKEPTDDAGGIKHWVDKLASGKSRGEVVAEMIWAAQQENNKGVAQDMFNNKVKVSNYVAENIEKAGDNLEVFKTFIAKVTSTDSSLNEAKAGVDAIKGNAALPAALDALNGAKKAKADYLKALPALDTDLNGEADIDAGKATDVNVSTLLGNIVNEIKFAVDDTGFGTRDADVQNLMLVKTKAALEKSLAEATKESTVTIAHIEAAKAKEEAVKAAEAAKKVAEAEFTTEAAKFGANNPVSGTSTYVPQQNDSDVDANGEFAFSANKDKLYFYTGGEKKTLATKANGTWTIEVDGKAQKGVSELLTAYEKTLTAAKAVTDAKNEVTAALKELVKKATGAYKVEGLGTINSVATLSNNDATIYKTKADAEFAGVKSVYTIDLTGASTGTGSAAKIKFGGVEVAGAGLADSEDANTIAGKLGGKTVAIDGVTYDIAHVADTARVTLTAQTVADVTASIAIAVENTTSPANPTTANVAPSTPGAAADSKKVTADLTKLNNLKVAAETLKDFMDKKKIFEEARAWDAEVKKLGKAITAAEQKIENKTDDKDAPGLGLKIKPYGASVVGDPTNDVILFDGETNASVSNFGVGLDRLYFGNKYKFVKLEKDVDPTANKAVGDVAVLEIFYKQDGGDVKLYAEKNAFGGQANGADEFVTITLTGTTLEKLTIADGFVSAGTLA